MITLNATYDTVLYVPRPTLHTTRAASYSFSQLGPLSCGLYLIFSSGSGNVDFLRPCSPLTPLCALEKPEGAHSNSPFLDRLERRTQATGPICVLIPTSLPLSYLTLGPSLTNSQSVLLHFTIQ